MSARSHISTCIVGLYLILATSLCGAQTCKNAIQLLAPDSRYEVNGDGTVTDLATKLMWQQCSAGQSGIDCASGSTQEYTWAQALQYPQTLNSSGGFAGFSDWRLPNQKELLSLVEEACGNPAINLTIFPHTASNWYWSSSPRSHPAGDAWFVTFSNGVSFHSYRKGSHHVRLVRSQ